MRQKALVGEWMVSNKARTPWFEISPVLKLFKVRMEMCSDCAAACGAAAMIWEETETKASVESVAARAGAAGGNGTRPLGGM